MASFLFGRKKRQKLGEKIYSHIRTASRRPAFFGPGKVPDTVDGRFEVLVAHAYLAMQGLRNADPARRIDQEVFDAMFRDMDDAVRELGTSDTQVGKKIKAMAKAFYGRCDSYHLALQSKDMEQISQAVRRNLLATVEEREVSEAFIAKLQSWLLLSATNLADQSLADIEKNGPDFAEIQ
jgi:cytochrome b pre-mRNA-processing protein 3